MQFKLYGEAIYSNRLFETIRMSLRLFEWMVTQNGLIEKYGSKCKKNYRFTGSIHLSKNSHLSFNIDKEEKKHANDRTSRIFDPC